MSRRSRERNEPEINLTPLIDVVFLLLIFFMVSTTFDRKSEILIQLPEAQLDAEPKQEKQEVVSIDSEGNYYLNGQALIDNERDTLINALRESMDDPANTPVIINADANVPHQFVVTVFEAAQHVGAYKVRIPVSQVEQESN